MSRTSGTGWRHKQGGGGGSSSSGRSRRHSSGSGGDSSRAMSHGGGQGFGGRPARSSMDGPGATQGRGGGWGGNVRTIPLDVCFAPLWANSCRALRVRAFGQIDRESGR